MLYVLVVSSNVTMIRLAVNCSQAHMAAALIVRYCTVFLFAIGVVTVMKVKVHVCLYMSRNFGL